MSRGSFRVRKCCIAGIEATEALTGHAFSRHTHDAFAFGRILEGGQRSWSGRGQVEAIKGDLISSNPGEVHDGTPLGTSRMWKMLYLSPSFVFKLVADLNEGRTGEFEFRKPVFDRSPFEAAFERCYAVVTEPYSNTLAAESALLTLFARLIAPSLPKAPFALPGLKRAKDRIDADPSQTISLSELAHLSGLSRFQALRGFTRLTGLPPHAYQVQRRLEHARQLIASGGRLSDVAAQTGFADQSHFHRLFVERFGFTPGAYAAALR